MLDSLLLNYNFAVENFENYLKTYPENIQQEGYLIKLKHYENLKKIINYYDYKNCYLNKEIDLYDEKPLTINPIEFRTSSYLINMLYNNNKYIMINKKFWEVICKKGKENAPPILYKHQSNNLIFKLDDNITLSFIQSNNSKNIIDKSSINFRYDSNFIEVKTIYKDIIKYYQFEKKFLNDLNSQNKITKDDYLVSKKWFDKWIKYTNYEYFKQYFLKYKKINEYDLINKLIYHIEKEKFNYFTLNNIEILNFNNIKEILFFLQKDSIAFINNISLINNNNNSQKISYNVYKKIIIFNINENIIFKTNNNIISLKNKEIHNYFSMINEKVKINNEIIINSTEDLKNKENKNEIFIPKII